MPSTTRLIALATTYGAEKYFTNIYEDLVKIGDRCSEEDINKFELTENDIVMFGGGEDIPPSYYNEEANRTAMYPVVPSRRDRLEKAFFQKAVESGAKMLGICRGAQMITALAGGKLWQHVENHNFMHTMDYNLDSLPNHLKLLAPDYTTSVHHQMCRVETIPMKVDLLAWSALSPVYFDEKGSKNLPEYKEPEIFYVPNLKALCFQGHPEFDSPTGDYAIFSKSLAAYYFGAKR